MKLKVNSCDGVYSNSLDVRFTKACDNRCSFCIERNGINALGETDVDKMIKSTIMSGKTDILILGGEPLLQPKLVLEYINGIRDKVDTIYLTTSLPKIITEGENNIIFGEIISLLDGINISLHHYDFRKNNAVLQSTNPYDRISFLEEYIKINKEFQNKARVCCNLTRKINSINSKNEVMNFLNKMNNIGVKNVKLNELQNVDKDTYISFEEMFNIEMKSPFAFGCQTNVNYLFPRYLKMNIILKRSCFCNKEEDKATLLDLGKCIIKRLNKDLNANNFMVLYENGNLENGWLKK